MKRPHGFDQPPGQGDGPAAKSATAVPATATCSSGTPSPSVRSPDSPATAFPPSRGNSPLGESVLGKSLLGNGSIGNGSIGNGVAANTSLPDSVAAAAGTPKPSKPSRSLPSRPQKTAAQLASAEARAARQRLRAAKRERRSYERREVRRFTERSRRRRTIWIVSLTAVVSLIAFVLIGAFSPLMALRTIQVDGASRIDAKSIVSALDDQIGRPLTLVDHAEIEKKLAAFPLIRSYSTESSPPDTLIVRIVERTPVALLQVASGFELVDSAGVVIEKSAKRPPNYPVIKTSTGDASGTGFDTAVSVLLALPDDLKANVDTVSAATQDDVTLTLVKGGPKVVWGSADDAEFKALVLSRLIETNKPSKVHEYDVSSPNAAVVR